MNLYLLRHGIAEDLPQKPGGHDRDRALTPEGERKLLRVVQAMEAMGLAFDLVLSSPYLRARQTAELVAENLKPHPKVEFSQTLEPGNSPVAVLKLVERLSPAPGELLMVGHEPNLSEILSLLTTGDSRLQVTMKKAGLCKLTAEAFAPRRCATLEWLLTPKLMGTME
jgi:phosphohistidine phosphatase